MKNLRSFAKYPLLIQLIIFRSFLSRKIILEFILGGNFTPWSLPYFFQAFFSSKIIQFISKNSQAIIFLYICPSALF
jgi:hypothetical protein